MTVDCAFYIRVQVSQKPTYRYTPLSIRNPRGDHMQQVDHPPSVGDFVFLHDEHAQASGSFVVVSRSWQWPSYESVSFPLGDDATITPARLVVIVEASPGPFANEEASEPEDQH